MENKKILIVSAVFPPEPVVSARLSADLYQAFKDDGRDVKVLHPEPSRPNGFKFDEGHHFGKDEVILHSYNCPQSSLLGRMRESWSFGKACERYIKEYHSEIDCIYANTWPIFSQKFIVRTAKKYDIPCIIHVQDVYPESLTNKMSGILGKVVKALVLPMDKYILRNCNRVVAISEKMKTFLSRTRNIEEQKIAVVINWQDEKDFLDYQNKSIENDLHPFTFMYMGNIGPVAGVELLIDAFVKTELKDARLVIAGSGSMKEKLKNHAAHHNNIEFWDVPNGRVPEIQAHADCMLLPIKKGAASSSIPSKLPAYMFSAKPIIGCMDADCDTANAIIEAGCGWVIEPENVEKLAENMRQVAVWEKSDLVERGEKAQGYGLSHFSKKENLNRLVKVIEEIL